MDPGIQMLELAIGIKEVLIDAGFTTIDSLVRMSPSDIATLLGIELYVGKIIIDAAKHAAATRTSDSRCFIGSRFSHK